MLVYYGMHVQVYFNCIPWGDVLIIIKVLYHICIVKS